MTNSINLHTQIPFFDAGLSIQQKNANSDNDNDDDDDDNDNNDNNEQEDVVVDPVEINRLFDRVAAIIQQRDNQYGPFRTTISG